MLRTLYQGTRKDLTVPAPIRKLEARNGRAVCPICGRLTAVRILPDTRLENFPLYCKHCRTTTPVEYREPEPQSLSR